MSGQQNQNVNQQQQQPGVNNNNNNQNQNNPHHNVGAGGVGGQVVGALVNNHQNPAAEGSMERGRLVQKICKAHMQTRRHNSRGCMISWFSFKAFLCRHNYNCNIEITAQL